MVSQPTVCVACSLLQCIDYTFFSYRSFCWFRSLAGFFPVDQLFLVSLPPYTLRNVGETAKRHIFDSNLVVDWWQWQWRRGVCFEHDWEIEKRKITEIDIITYVGRRSSHVIRVQWSKFRHLMVKLNQYSLHDRVHELAFSECSTLLHEIICTIVTCSKQLKVYI